MPKTIYIAGPMSGLPNNGYDAFNRKAAQLKTAGWHVVNPADMDIQSGLAHDREFTRFDYMQAARRDLLALNRVDAIYMLDGYENSPGACWEWAYSKQLGHTVYYETPLETNS
jgi:nucleoside 2-deoxyribosyltransferase